MKQTPKSLNKRFTDAILWFKITIISQAVYAGKAKTPKDLGEVTEKMKSRVSSILNNHIGKNMVSNDRQIKKTEING